ncbi:MAG TPA: hypothetical protein VMW66_01670, partial [Elusimicrobiales bacterium]|nr:hypothetical protein [Elusimicrobiales bacterium]
ISTSGNSKNVIEAVKTAKSKCCYVIGFLGNGGGKLASMVNLPIIIKSSDTARIQECHIFICHELCHMVETNL